MRLRVLLADDHQLVRAGIRAILEKEPSIEVVGEANDGRQAVDLCFELLPDLLIIDLSMPNLNGLEVTRQVRHQAASVRILALSMRSDPAMIAQMLQAGAQGYLLKSSAPRELIDAITFINRGQIYLDPAVAALVVQHNVRKNPHDGGYAQQVLTGREREILQLITEGKSSKQAAKLLFISSKTVEAHRAQVMAKLKIRTIAQLTKYAIREGVTSVEQ